MMWCGLTMLLTHGGEFRSLMPSLALVFHVCRDPNSSESISLEDTNRAVTWCRILRSHASKLYDLVLDGQRGSSEVLASKISEGHVKTGMKIRDLRRRNWSQLTSIQDVDCALSSLEGSGWIRVASSCGPQHSKFIEINPSLKVTRGKR